MNGSILKLNDFKPNPAELSVSPYCESQRVTSTFLLHVLPMKEAHGHHGLNFQIDQTEIGTY